MGGDVARDTGTGSAPWRQAAREDGGRDVCFAISHVRTCTTPPLLLALQCLPVLAATAVAARRCTVCRLASRVTSFLTMAFHFENIMSPMSKNLPFFISHPRRRFTV